MFLVKTTKKGDFRMVSKVFIKGLKGAKKGLFRGFRGLGVYAPKRAEKGLKRAFLGSQKDPKKFRVLACR